MESWQHRDQPSEHFLGAIRRAYDQAKTKEQKPTPSSLWDYVVMECLRSPNGFREMFAWDRRKNVNRIGTIMEAIKAGLVPGLRIELEGRKVVVIER